MRREVDLGYLYTDVGHGGPFYLEELPMNDKTPFLTIVDEIVEMHDRKQADYGREGDPFANVRASGDFGVPAWVGCMIRANDKMKRIQKAAAGGQLVNESVEDSLLDLAVYAIIGLVLYREGRPTAPEPEPLPVRTRSYDVVASRDLTIEPVCAIWGIHFIVGVGEAARCAACLVPERDLPKGTLDDPEPAVLEPDVRAVAEDVARRNVCPAYGVHRFDVVQGDRVVCICGEPKPDPLHTEPGDWAALEHGRPE